jgi:hypothetical protein
MKKMLAVAMFFLFAFQSQGQAQKLWTEKDRAYLLENLRRSRDELVKETQNLTEAQWRFRESPDRWSIQQVVEHLAIWELLFQREISLAYGGGAKPELAATATPDSVTLNYLSEEKSHVATDYTKPFTFTVPMGLNTGENTLAWLQKMRNESIGFIGSTNDDLRTFFNRPGRSIHYTYLSTFGHTDRHLKQIQKIKTHPNYPK